MEVGGARLAYLATASEAQVPSGSYLSTKATSKATTVEEGFEQAQVSKEAQDDKLAARLWQRSAEAVSIVPAS